MKLLGKERKLGDDVVIYRHEHNGHVVRTHRTVRTSPAGWVWTVYNAQTYRRVNQGYASTQRQALWDAEMVIDNPVGEQYL